LETPGPRRILPQHCRSTRKTGRTEEARRAAGRVLELKPAFKLADYAASQPYKDRGHLDRLLDRLKAAGLA
jgi:hypothetical protein